MFSALGSDYALSMPFTTGPLLLCTPTYLAQERRPPLALGNLEYS